MRNSLLDPIVIGCSSPVSRLYADMDLILEMYTVDPLLTTTPDVRTLSLERSNCHVPKNLSYFKLTPEIRMPLYKFSFPNGGLNIGVPLYYKT